MLLRSEEAIQPILETEAEYRPVVLALSEASLLPDKTLRGRDSRLPPQVDPGASARTEASVSMLRRRRLEDEANVTILALSLDWWMSVFMDRWRGIAETVLRFDGAGDTGYW